MNDVKQTILDTRAKMESMDYDEWVKAMEKANAPVLKKFKAWLSEAGLAAKTIARHVNNVDLFVNVYQTHYDYCGTMFDGWSDFDDCPRGIPIYKKECIFGRVRHRHRCGRPLSNLGSHLSDRPLISPDFAGLVRTDY